MILIFISESFFFFSPNGSVGHNREWIFLIWSSRGMAVLQVHKLQSPAGLQGTANQIKAALKGDSLFQTPSLVLSCAHTKLCGALGN